MHGPKLEDLMPTLYADLDRQFTGRVAGRHVSCQRGCTFCCHQIVGIGSAEALYLAQEILRRPDWRGWVNRLAAAAREVSAPDVTRASWFLRREPCVFLDTATGDCQVYAQRPGACRWYAVRTPPENCAPGAATPQVRIYSSAPEQGEIIRLDTALHETHPELWQRAGGPLPLMVLYAITWLLRPVKTERRFMRQRLQGLPTPAAWMAAFLARHRASPAVGDAWDERNVTP